MKKIISVVFLLLSVSSFTFAQTNSENNLTDNETINPKTGFPEIKQKPFVFFNEGVSFAQITRIEKQENRSNFVRENYLIGAFLKCKQKT
jgi:hypothetical protein